MEDHFPMVRRPGSLPSTCTMRPMGRLNYREVSAFLYGQRLYELTTGRRVRLDDSQGSC